MASKNDKQFFTALESLRGIAALMVVIFHISPWYIPFFDFVYARNGFLMVDFFFVLSGFVMSLNYGGRLQNVTQLKKFAVLRFVRLYPVHLVFLLLFLGVECLKYVVWKRGIGGGGAIPFETNSASAFVEQLFLVQALGFSPEAASSFNGPSWSISTEYYTYLVFGLSLLVFGRKRLTWLSLAVALASGAAYFSLPQELHSFDYILRCLCGFFVGCIVYAIYARGKRWPDFVTSIALIAIFIFLGFSNLQKPVVVMIPLAALLILSIVNSSKGGPSWLNWAPFRTLGTISYSLYMSHALVLWIANQVLRFVFHFPVRSTESGLFPEVPFKAALVVYPVTVLACLIAGALTYRLVEQPSLRWTQKLKQRKL